MIHRRFCWVHCLFSFFLVLSLFPIELRFCSHSSYPPVSSLLFQFRDVVSVCIYWLFPFRSNSSNIVSRSHIFSNLRSVFLPLLRRYFLPTFMYTFFINCVLLGSQSSLSCIQTVVSSILLPPITSIINCPPYVVTHFRRICIVHIHTFCIPAHIFRHVDIFEAPHFYRRFHLVLAHSTTHAAFPTVSQRSNYW